MKAPRNEREAHLYLRSPIGDGVDQAELYADTIDTDTPRFHEDARRMARKHADVPAPKLPVAVQMMLVAFVVSLAVGALLQSCGVLTK